MTGQVLLFCDILRENVLAKSKPELRYRGGSSTSFKLTSEYRNFRLRSWHRDCNAVISLFCISFETDILRPYLE